MDTNGNERAAVDNGVYYNGIANIQLTDTTCIFHQVDYNDYKGILGSTSRSNVQVNISGTNSIEIFFAANEWGYTKNGSFVKGDFLLPVQNGTYSNKNGWIKIGGKTYTISKSVTENEDDKNDK